MLVPSPGYICQTPGCRWCAFLSLWALSLSGSKCSENSRGCEPHFLLPSSSFAPRVSLPPHVSRSLNTSAMQSWGNSDLSSVLSVTVQCQTCQSPCLRSCALSTPAQNPPPCRPLLPAGAELSGVFHTSTKLLDSWSALERSKEEPSPASEEPPLPMAWPPLALLPQEGCPHP